MPEIRRKTGAPDAGASYRAAALACYTANFIGALVINLTPILFIPLKTLYGLTYTEFGLLLAANYVTRSLPTSYSAGRRTVMAADPF